MSKLVRVAHCQRGSVLTRRPSSPRWGDWRWEDGRMEKKREGGSSERGQRDGHTALTAYGTRCGWTGRRDRKSWTGLFGAVPPMFAEDESLLSPTPLCFLSGEFLKPDAALCCHSNGNELRGAKTLHVAPREEERWRIWRMLILSGIDFDFTQRRSWTTVINVFKPTSTQW